MIELAIIGGTGLYDPKLLGDIERLELTTRYGTALLTQGVYEGVSVVFLARHGVKHGTPPHKINYRANMAALVKLGVTRVIATAAVGSPTTTSFVRGRSMAASGGSMPLASR